MSGKLAEVTNAATEQARSYLDPPVRWAGGKRWLVDRLVPEIEATKPSYYIEPFLGGGAIALGLDAKIPKLLLDGNPTLMDVWRCIKELPPALDGALRRAEVKYGESEIGYYQARARLNEMIHERRMIWCERAACALYINARCFNGLWRTNTEGFFNVPYGHLKKPRKISLAEITALSIQLRSAKLVTGDALELEWRSGSGVTIYADPPYHGTFADYTKDSFGETEQSLLANKLREYVELGAKIWTTNADTPFIRNAYAWASIEEISERHSVGATGERRGLKTCLLIRGG